jgi:hypothetical protein
MNAPLSPPSPPPDPAYSPISSILDCTTHHISVLLTKSASTSWASPSATVLLMSPHRYVRSVTYAISRSVYDKSPLNVLMTSPHHAGLWIIIHSRSFCLDAHGCCTTHILPHLHLLPSSSYSHCMQEATYAEYAYTHGLIPLEAKLKAERYHQKCTQKVRSRLRRI